MDPTPTVDAIIVTWNSAPDLPACLASLPPAVRPLIVDNGSADASVELARAARAVVLEIGTNLGFPRAVNLALEEVRAPFTLLLNPDVVLDPGCIERCLAVLEADPTIGIVGANTRQPDGRAEPPAARRDRRLLHILVETFGLQLLDRRLDRQMVHDRSQDRDVDAVNGAFMLARSDLLRDVGGLDEHVFMYFEDQDLCRRVRDRGLRVRFVADAGAVHGSGTSTARGDAAARTRAYLHRIDADLELLRRYGRPHEPPFAALAYALRCCIGLVVSIGRPDRRHRYAAALPYALRQLRRRVPPPPV